MLSSQSLTEIDSYCQRVLEEWRVPGAAVAIIQGKEVVFQKGYGTQKHGENIPVTAETLFPIASITKSFAATSLALLVDAGKLKWDDRVSEHLPGFKLRDPWMTREFQIIDLICHRSGFRAESLDQMGIWGYSRQDIQRGFQHIEPVTSFRTTYAYVNGLYLWVEDLIQTITGQKWSDFVKDNILIPLGMENTDAIDAVPQSGLIHGHILDEETRSHLISRQFSSFPLAFLAAGGLVSSVQDLSKWVAMHLGHLGLLSKESRQFLHSPKTQMESFFSYGGGLRIYDDRPCRVLGHGGLIAGVRHQFLCVPERDAGIVILTNLTHSEAPVVVGQYFLDQVMGLPFKDHSQLLKETNPVVPKSRPKPSGQKVDLSVFKGVYHSPILGKVIIEEGAADLVMTLGPKQAKAELKHIQGWEFQIYFLGEAGALHGEGHWGTATFGKDDLILKGYKNFEDETFTLKIYSA